MTVVLKNTIYYPDIVLACYDMTGRKVFHAGVLKGQKEVRLDISGWVAGLYMAVVTSQGRVMGEKRFVVMR